MGGDQVELGGFEVDGVSEAGGFFWLVNDVMRVVKENMGSVRLFFRA